MIVVDIASWTSRAIDRTAGRARAAGGSILTYDGDRVVVPRRRRASVTAFAPDGRRLFRVLRGNQVNSVVHAGTRAYALTERTIHTIDLRTRRVVGQRRARAARIDVTLVD